MACKQKHLTLFLCHQVNNNSLIAVLIAVLPIVGMVVTISPSLSLQRTVVFPAASRPTWRTKNILCFTLLVIIHESKSVDLISLKIANCVLFKSYTTLMFYNSFVCVLFLCTVNELTHEYSHLPLLSFQTRKKIREEKTHNKH